MASTSQGDEGWPRVTPTRRLADEWALVLAAEGLSPAVLPDREGFALRVPAHQEERAAQTLAAYLHENRRPDRDRPPAQVERLGDVEWRSRQDHRTQDPTLLDHR